MPWPGLHLKKYLSGYFVGVGFRRAKLKPVDQSGDHWNTCHGSWGWCELGFSMESAKKLWDLEYIFQLEATEWIE